MTNNKNQIVLRCFAASVTDGGASGTYIVAARPSVFRQVPVVTHLGRRPLQQVVETASGLYLRHQ